MQVVLGVAIGVVLIFVIVSIIKKIIMVIVGSTVLVALIIGGYFFLFGDGSVSQEYLPQKPMKVFKIYEVMLGIKLRTKQMR